MHIRDFAEQVLFATSLEEKLRPPPDDITDDSPGPAIATPALPGRPAQLRFKPQGTGRTAAVPGLAQLEDPRERGSLLHFFANHELLATELMALALLRFPDAPAAFRRGVLRTLQDEQQHTRLYLARMHECGVGFGERPVSGYIWRCVAPMDNPIDYVAGLSLTFEQANLDFARHFSEGFSVIGDHPTAALLEKIYRDEIGHVAYGLKWFRRWKSPGTSDWDAFCRHLKFPLSPQRAKGFSFNSEGRRAAGLDDAFIAHLDTFAQSKGRTPGVFVFNPFAEGFIAHGRGYMPTQPQRQLAEDLATLPQFLCRQDDIVLVPRRPRVEFLSELKRAGFALPEFVEHGEVAHLAHRKLGPLRPWAWGPDSVERFTPLFDRATAKHSAPDTLFNDRIAPLYSKAWSADFLRALLAKHGAHSWLCTTDEVGVTATSAHDALAAVAAIRARGHHRVVIKEAFGLAGRNALRLWEPAITAAQHRWLERACADGRRVVIEPWLERLVDFSVQFEMTPRGLTLRGFTGLVTDARGQFVANWAEPNYNRRLPAPVAAAFAPDARIATRLHAFLAQVRSALEGELRDAGHLGPVGVDAFVFRSADGTARIKPVVEINPRYTMGRLTLELTRHVAPGGFGAFRLVNRAVLRAAGAADFATYAATLATRHPLVLDHAAPPKIREGTLCLNDPVQAQACLAVFQVGRTLATVLHTL